MARGRQRLIISSLWMFSRFIMRERRLFSCPTMSMVLPRLSWGSIVCSQYTLDRESVHLRLSHWGILCRNYVCVLIGLDGIEFDHHFFFENGSEKH